MPVSSAQVDTTPIQVMNSRIESLEKQLYRQIDREERDISTQKQDADQRMDRIEDRAYQLMWSIAGGAISMIVVLLGAGYLTIAKQVKTHIRDFVKSEHIEAKFSKELQTQLSEKFERQAALNKPLIQGLASFYSGDFESAYHSFQSLYETEGQRDPFVTAHYAYLADLVNDDLTARRLYGNLIVDESAFRDDNYAKSAINYANFLLKDTTNEDEAIQSALKR